MRHTIQGPAQGQMEMELGRSATLTAVLLPQHRQRSAGGYSSLPSTQIPDVQALLEIMDPLLAQAKDSAFKSVWAVRQIHTVTWFGH